MTAQGCWQAWAASTVGRAHRAGRRRCQDHCRCRVMRRNSQPFAIGVVADGAGSAKCGRLGAKLACEALLASGRRMIVKNPHLAGVGRDQISGMFQQARDAIARHARHRPMRDYATTLAVAILGPDGCVFAQIGDSVIVAGDSGGYAPIFWPENGEFVNTTSFLTEGNFEEHLGFEKRPSPVLEVALFTDGLSPIALNLREQKAHGPFFSPLFDQLCTAIRRRTPRFIVERDLRRFLRSEAVENRVDDDRSLVLICARRQESNDGNLLGRA